MKSPDNILLHFTLSSCANIKETKSDMILFDGVIIYLNVYYREENF